MWRGVGLADPSGRSGGYIGQPTYYKVTWRWRSHFELDTGYVVLREGSFLRSVLGEQRRGWGRFFYVASDWRF
jgi:hypothetical protein